MRWAQERLDCYFGPCYTIANYLGDRLKAVVIFHNMRVGNCEVSIYSDGGITKDFLMVVFQYAFDFCNLRRLNALVSVENQKSIDLVERLNFQREGLIRRGSDNGTDVYLYGMLREECKWVEKTAVAAAQCRPRHSISH